MTDYGSIAIQVGAALAEVGTSATLYRRGRAYVSEHSPVYADPTPHKVTVMIDSYSLREQAANLVEMGDKKVLMSADGLAIEPTTDDWLVVDGVEYSIENVDSLEPAGLSVLYEIQARRRIVEEQYG